MVLPNSTVATTTTMVINYGYNYNYSSLTQKNQQLSNSNGSTRPKSGRSSGSRILGSSRGTPPRKAAKSSPTVPLQQSQPLNPELDTNSNLEPVAPELQLSETQASRASGHKRKFALITNNKPENGVSPNGQSDMSDHI